MSKVTFYFKQILPNFDLFKVFAEGIGIDTDTMSEADVKILEHCYNLLIKRYSLSNIRYMKPDHFLDELGITFDDEWKRYLKRYKIIEKALQLTDDDLIVLNKEVQNYANNPNDAVTYPLEPLSYISSQTFRAGLSNKLQAYLLAIETLPSEYDEEFLSHFKHLFMNIIPQGIPYYESEEDD